MKVKDFPKPIRNWLYKYIIFRPAIVYAFSCIDPATGLRELWAYVGQTRQDLDMRYNQHMGYDPRQPAQSWSDLYPEVRVIWSGNCPNFVLDFIEKWYIKHKKPLYNYIHNTQNPRRITKYQAANDRRYRDLDKKYQHGVATKRQSW